MSDQVTASKVARRRMTRVAGQPEELKSVPAPPPPQLKPATDLYVFEVMSDLVVAPSTAAAIAVLRVA